MFAHSRLSSGYFVILHYYWRVSLHYIVPALLYYCAVHHQMTDNNSQCSIFMHVKFIYSEKSTKFCKIFTLLLIVCTVVKSKGKVSQNFVAFSDYMNFNKIWNDTFIDGLQTTNVFIQMTLYYVLTQHFLLIVVHTLFWMIHSF